jgi:hypothetical protein
MRLSLTLLAAVFALALVSASSALAADSSKTGVVKSVDAKAKTFVLAREGFPPLTLTVNDKTAITLDDKASTFDAAIKADLKVTVTYAKVGNDRVASKVEVTSAKK